jgi:hypothetical protein
MGPDQGKAVAVLFVSEIDTVDMGDGMTVSFQLSV